MESRKSVWKIKNDILNTNEDKKIKWYQDKNNIFYFWIALNSFVVIKQVVDNKGFLWINVLFCTFFSFMFIVNTVNYIKESR